MNLTSAAAVMVFPGTSAYSLSKLASTQMLAFVAAENPNVTAVAMHPGIVMTDMTLDFFVPVCKRYSWPCGWSRSLALNRKGCFPKWQVYRVELVGRRPGHKEGRDCIAGEAED